MIAKGFTVFIWEVAFLHSDLLKLQKVCRTVEKTVCVCRLPTYSSSLTKLPSSLLWDRLPKALLKTVLIIVSFSSLVLVLSPPE